MFTNKWYDTVGSQGISLDRLCSAGSKKQFHPYQVGTFVDYLCYETFFLSCKSLKNNVAVT